MPDFIAVDVKGLPELRAKQEKLPLEARNTITDEVNKDILNVMKAYEPYKHITMQQAYGGFISTKQRKWFFAALANGDVQIGNHRTQKLSKGWKIEGKGYESMIVNQTPYAAYVMDDQYQANLPGYEGWKTVGMRIREHMTKFIATADAAVKKAIRKLNL